MPQVDIITGEARHRTWTLDEKLSILDAAFAPGAVVAHVACRVSHVTRRVYGPYRECAASRPSRAPFTFSILPPQRSPDHRGTSCGLAKALRMFCRLARAMARAGSLSGIAAKAFTIS